ncbi:hypothetical protein K1X45_01970 [Pseudochrobactrum sp. Wa41.01b-1]|uniref:hypothetical protein n=1 Tax=Pseudochrobactrum sp. Wa41.01b-1 TaxID=2864102 RepID=UPI001C692643|nr:hypothetical protein [Pseudochrobactrum sp. Wa41.01b-1]QYM73239.1 hypothetical protein K1X45_01970 [Pseudochrobactrum sp. Wa41.01b-1]
MAEKPSSKLIAKALPRNDKFAGQFSLPGLVPALVRTRDGGIELFNDERSAEIAAMEAVIRLYNSRTIDTRKAGGYRRLTGAELANVLNDINITPTYFAEIAGVPQHRVMKWLDGEQDIPHSVHVLAKLIARNDENFKIAEAITEDYEET